VDEKLVRKVRMQRRWLLLPVIVVVVAGGTWSIQRMTRAPEPVVAPAASGAALSEQQLRDLLSRPPAPLTFLGFDEEAENNGVSPPPWCWARPTEDGLGEQDVLLAQVTGPSYAPEYRTADTGADILLMRVPPSARTEVTRLLADPAECRAEDYHADTPYTEEWGTSFPVDMGDAARLVRTVHRNPTDSEPLATINYAQLVAVSGPWIVFATSNSYGSAPSKSPGQEEAIVSGEQDAYAGRARSALALPGLVRTALRPLDAAVGTTFSVPPPAPKPCTAEALGEDDLRNATGAGVTLAVGMHDAACRNDPGWLEEHRAPTFFVNGGLRYGIDAHNTNGDHVPNLPALAEAIEAGPLPSAGGRSAFAARGWTFALERRFDGLAGFLGHSNRCATAQASVDAICDAAQNRGVVGLDWEPDGMAAGCDGQPVDIKQRIYLAHRSPSVPDVAVRSTCTPVSTGNRPYDVTVLDGQRSAGDRATVLSSLVTEADGYIVGPLSAGGRTLYIPVEFTLAGETRWDPFTVGLQWNGSSYEVVSRE